MRKPLDGRKASIPMTERRVEAQVIGPGSSGNLKVRFDERDRDVRTELIPPALRTPNTRFVAVVEGADLVRIEPAGREWLEIQDRVRAVLNECWDPIGVADAVDDEYDSYIGGIYSMLRRHASRDALAAHLLQIEAGSMGLPGLPAERRLETARRLLTLELPAL